MSTKKPTPPAWKTSTAKKLLRADIIDGTVTEEMDPKAVFTMRPEFQLYLFSRFKCNLKNLHESIKNGTGLPKPIPWGKSEAKQRLRDDIINGIVSPEMDADLVYRQREDCHIYKIGNFRTNLKNLRENINLHHQRMIDDVAFYVSDRKLLKRIREREPLKNTRTNWLHSDARKQLKIDVDNKLHTQMKPSVLYNRPDRAVYREFPPDIFRKHLHQEVTERASKAHRFAKRKLRPRGPAPEAPPINY